MRLDLYFCTMRAKNQVVKSNEIDRQGLQAEIDAFRQRIENTKSTILAFEAKLRAALAEELILELELSTLYKEQKKAKKEKRLEQKKRGKNYQEPKGLIKSTPSKKTDKSPVDALALKKLYREAMLLIHPDKFNMQEDKQELAHEATTQLIQLYRQGDLDALQTYVSHILNGNLLEGNVSLNLIPKDTDPLEYLKHECQKLQAELSSLQNQYTYRVWTTYDDPYTFVEELRAYYLDRIKKLKKRTRTKC
jgi:regulator of replication initiation timing